jgi:phage protein D
MATRAPLLVVALVASLAGQPVTAQKARLQAVISGAVLPAARVASIVVDAGTSDVDAATVTLDLGRTNLPAIGDSLEVIGGARVFKGEIVGIEPVFDAGGESRVIVRAFNRLHRLTRAPKSRTFENMTDAGIVARIAADNGLAAGPALPETSGPGNVDQNNQTDLAFLRERAARIGLDVAVDDNTLMLRRPVDADPVPLRCSGKPTLNRFHPRLSSTVPVSAVIVRGWDPQQKKDIVGKASRVMIALSPGAEAIVDRGQVLDLGMVAGIESQRLPPMALRTAR